MNNFYDKTFWIIWISNALFLIFVIISMILPIGRGEWKALQLAQDKTYIATMCNGKEDCWNDTIKGVVLTNGFYKSEGFYCVRTNAEWYMNENKTDKHESCHAFIKHDDYHFCEENRGITKE